MGVGSEKGKTGGSIPGIRLKNQQELSGAESVLWQWVCLMGSAGQGGDLSKLASDTLSGATEDGVERSKLVADIILIVSSHRGD